MIDLVKGARSDGVRAFGIVDRDVLLNDQDWPLWWEHQDHVFLAARPYGNHIRVLLRWDWKLLARPRCHVHCCERCGDDVEAFDRNRSDIMP